MKKLIFISALMCLFITLVIGTLTGSTLKTFLVTLVCTVVFLLAYFLRERWMKKTKDSSDEIKKKTKQEKLLEELEGRATITWEDVFKVFNNFGASHPIILQHLPTMSLLDIVKISHLKRQIVWGNDHLNLALFILEENVRLEFNDNKLKLYLQLLEELITTTRNTDTKEYVGSKNLFEKIKSECRKSFELLAEDFKRA